MFENIIKFFKKFGKNEKENSKNTAKERLHLVLAQDRANISADFLEMMKQEIIDVIKKYIDIDEEAIDVRMTNKPGEDGTLGAPSLYANIPIVTIKNEARKLEGKSEEKAEEKTIEKKEEKPEKESIEKEEEKPEKESIEKEEEKPEKKAVEKNEENGDNAQENTNYENLASKEEEKESETEKVNKEKEVGNNSKEKEEVKHNCKQKVEVEHSNNEKSRRQAK